MFRAASATMARRSKKTLRPNFGSRWKPSISLSQASNGITSPTRWRSSGTWPTPSARTERGSHSAACSSRPWTRISPPGDRPDSRQRLEQLRLAIAGDAGDAENLALRAR